jgi:hypothetical protein
MDKTKPCTNPLNIFLNRYTYYIYI